MSGLRFAHAVKAKQIDFIGATNFRQAGPSETFLCLATVKGKNNPSAIVSRLTSLTMSVQASPSSPTLFFLTSRGEAKEAAYPRSPGSVPSSHSGRSAFGSQSSRSAKRPIINQSAEGHTSLHQYPPSLCAPEPGGRLGATFLAACLACFATFRNWLPAFCRCGKAPMA